MNQAAIDRNRLPLSDREIDALGTYFIQQDLLNKYTINFEQFIKKVRDGTWAKRFTV